VTRTASATARRKLLTAGGSQRGTGDAWGASAKVQAPPRFLWGGPSTIGLGEVSRQSGVVPLCLASPDASDLGSAAPRRPWSSLLRLPWICRSSSKVSERDAGLDCEVYPPDWTRHGDELGLSATVRCFGRVVQMLWWPSTPEWHSLCDVAQGT